MLPACRWKRAVETKQMQGACEAQHFTNGKQIPVCRSLSAYKRRERRGKVALFYSRKRSDWCFQLVAGSAYCNSVYAQGMPWEHFTDGNENTCLPIFNCFQTERATRQRRPLLKLKTQRLALPARRWKRSLQLGICTGMRWEHFTDGKQNTYLPIFKCSQEEMATRQRRPLLQQKGQRSALPARRWKRLLQLCICRGDAMGTLYRRQTKYLFADL